MAAQDTQAASARFEKIVVITQKTALEELVERFNSVAQARFYIEHLGGSFEEYEAANARYAASVEILKRSIPRGVKTHVIERGFLPNYLFSERDLVVTIGPDGLVVNAAKVKLTEPPSTSVIAWGKPLYGTSMKSIFPIERSMA